jgi:hypothetical protein
VEIYGRAGRATDGNIIRRMRFASWIAKATDTHTFDGNNVYANAPQCYGVHTSRVLL